MNHPRRRRSQPPFVAIGIPLSQNIANMRLGVNSILRYHMGRLTPVLVFSGSAHLESQWDKTRDIKQGMMQELLTGRTRLI